MYGSRNRIVISAMALRNTQAMGLLPPVAPFSLLFPYPPNAGRLIKHPPTRFATPSATSSLFALSCIPGKSDEEPRLFAATVDSKKPSSAMTNDVLMASRMCGMFAGWKGQRNVKRRPDAALMGAQDRDALGVPAELPAEDGGDGDDEEALGDEGDGGIPGLEVLLDGPVWCQLRVR